jgi:hypothetical protein
MTQMFPKFFGVHQYVIRSGMWTRLRPGTRNLYIFLTHKSERMSSRKVVATDAEISATVGVKQRTLCNARKQLSEMELVQCRRGAGNKFTYILCDPETGKPYAGDPKTPVLYQKQSQNAPGREESPHQPARRSDDEPCGMPLKFD